MKRILYISASSYFDTDFPLIKELRKISDLYCLFFIYPDNLNNTMIELGKSYPKTGIFKVKDIYPQFDKFSDYLDLDKTYVVNRLSRNKLSFANFISCIKLIWFILKLKISVIYDVLIYQVLDWPLTLFFRKTYAAVHDPFPHSGVSSNNARKNEMMLKMMAKCSRGMILFNKTLAQTFMEKYQLKKDSLYVSRIGTNCLNRDFLLDERQEQRFPYILFWGRIEPYKGIEFLLQAMEKVHSQMPDIHLVVAGRGKPYFDYDHYKYLSYIHFDNRFLSVTELAELVNGCLFVVCPYVDATQSGVVTTAFSFDKPVVGSRVGAIPEYVKDGEFGRLIEPRNVDDLSSTLLELLSNKELINFYSDNIRTYYTSDEGSWTGIANRLFNHITK